MWTSYIFFIWISLSINANLCCSILCCHPHQLQSYSLLHFTDCWINLFSSIPRMVCVVLLMHFLIARIIISNTWKLLYLSLFHFSGLTFAVFASWLMKLSTFRQTWTKSADGNLLVLPLKGSSTYLVIKVISFVH